MKLEHSENKKFFHVEGERIKDEFIFPCITKIATIVIIISALQISNSNSFNQASALL